MIASAPLGELCDIVIGRTPARANPAYWGPGEPWLSIADMNQGLDIVTTKEQITAAGAIGGKRVPPGTVLISFKLSIGKVGIARVPLFTNEAIAALPIRDPARLDPGYLAQALAVLDWAGNSNRAAMGAVLNKAKLQVIPVPLPPIEEQRRIAAILDQAEAICSKRRLVLARLDALTQSTFHAMFAGTPKRSRLKDMGVDFLSGKNVLGSDTDAHPVNRVIKVSAISGGRFVRTESKPMPRDYSPPATHRLQRGDVLFGRASGSLDLLGATALVDVDPGELFLPDKVWRLETKPGAVVLPAFILAVLRSPEARAFIRHRASGAAGVRNIRKSELLEYLAPLPPLPLQREFEARSEAINAQIALVRGALAADIELSESLRFRAFRGELY
ncbi:restriction endonuclease subunit S [Cellulomonas sp. PS-H5]|uniref:restriction endonuclease subunit S n=1 Tax=Cellulomonas sp. PS-H5 TaxID=2820400 RepID=UPI001C4EA9B8|nr:restriction endonuclease subunit S [Cellulomonas sp. PS-H5]MBW0252472.1 restriction endonuclease subunit S [Cellulomonas sp. PS-H5]